MADLSALGKVTDYFASGLTRRDAILRRYGAPVMVGSQRAKGDFDASPITLFEDPRSQQLQQPGGGAVLDVDKVFYTRAATRGADEFAATQGDEIVLGGDIFQIERLNPLRDGHGDEIFVKRVGKVGHAPY